MIPYENLFDFDFVFETIKFEYSLREHSVYRVHKLYLQNYYELLRSEKNENVSCYLRRYN